MVGLPGFEPRDLLTPRPVPVVGSRRASLVPRSRVALTNPLTRGGPDHCWSCSASTAVRIAATSARVVGCSTLSGKPWARREALTRACVESLASSSISRAGFAVRPVDRRGGASGARSGPREMRVLGAAESDASFVYGLTLKLRWKILTVFRFAVRTQPFARPVQSASR